MKIPRRDFIALLGGVAGWPFAARAQQPAMPVVGFLSYGSADAFANRAAAFRRGLAEAGYVVGKNVEIEYRWADGVFDRLPALASDLVGRRVAVIVTAGGDAAALSAKAATASIPIVFNVGGDPVKAGLVASLNRPEGNVTGLFSFSVELGAKRIGLLRDLVPQIAVIAVLHNPTNPNTTTQLVDAQAAARAMGIGLRVLSAAGNGEIDKVFEISPSERPDALLVFNDPLFNGARSQIATLANRSAIPAIYPFRDFAAAGGLMSYGTSNIDEYRQSGVYAGRILKGEKPANLPVQQSTKFEFVINLKTVKALGLTLPPGLLAIADEVIE